MNLPAINLPLQESIMMNLRRICLLVFKRLSQFLIRIEEDKCPDKDMYPVDETELYPVVRI